METTDDVTGPNEPQATTTEWSPELATVLTGAVELARAAIIEFSGDDTVGEYLGVGYEDPTGATHRFLADLPGYQGWQWAVVVAGYPGADHATVSEVVLVPGPDGVAGAAMGALGSARQAGRPEPRRPAGARGGRPAAGARLHGLR